MLSGTEGERPAHHRDERRSRGQGQGDRVPDLQAHEHVDSLRAVRTRTGGVFRASRPCATCAFRVELHFQSCTFRVTGLCSTLDLHLCTSALETGYLGELQLGSAERAAHAVLAARSLSLGPARQWCAGALDSARYREHFAGSTLQGALYREHFTGSTLLQLQLQANFVRLDGLFLAVRSRNVTVAIGFRR